MPVIAHAAQGLLHFHGHVDAGDGVFLYTLGLRITEEEHDGVANVLVDSRAIAQGNFCHGAQIQIKHLCDIFRFQVFNNVGKGTKVSKEDRQFLARAGTSDGFRAGKNRLVELWGKVL